jgi:hypothetical protein
MATHKNPANANRDLSVLAQGQLGFDRFTFDLEASYAAGCEAADSLIEVGFVPPDCKLVEHLSRIYIPELDTNGSATGDHSLGTAASAAALLASTDSSTASTVYFGEDLLRQTASIGAHAEPTPIYIKVINIIATLGTGVIVFEPVFRAWNPAIDGAP